ncbi:SafA/ExsA family spore coat assembly protein [Crassaminicella thermophila]|uniref:SafA/ExsA family spore coat assembly protein n=1 Tax=Crassaminicella thermophila TaxID=2599308 RepID=A0A5C0SEJ2_CRATE|nr:SafA/ExsA family spore coat assembly protein [Crassaminicella thermophila]QEK12853.1 SafA/ExsA family spore coat assembly protein [Crassaminicella thermophila]
MKKFLIGGAIAILLSTANPLNVQAASQVHTVLPGDTLWKIAQKYEVGLSELIDQNKQLQNPNIIYPGMKIMIPDMEAGRIFEKEVIRLVNIEREKVGVKPLKENWQLSRVARYKSKDMKEQGYFSHTSPIYGSPFEMIKNFGIKYSYAGENIAKGQRSPQEVVHSWMNSSGHRRNILNPNYTEIGVGFAKDERGTTYWTQMFIKPRNW